MKPRRHSAREKKVLTLTCPRCRNSWDAEPKRWKNLESVFDNGEKLIHCPFCGKLIKIPKKETLILLKQRQ
jgi:ssDNA-binding Zn-finger/Zn-ribbon topoisomerase 1